MQIEVASHQKRQRCENCKENTKCLTIYQEVNFNFNYPRANKSVKILDMSLRLKKVCPVYKTHPITELKLILTLITPEQTKVSKYWTGLSD